MTQEDVHFIDKSAESEVGSPVGSAVSVPTLSEPGLLVMDVDSTLIDEEVIDELGVVAGCGEEIAGVTARAMRGELEFCDALRARVALLEGLRSPCSTRCMTSCISPRVRWSLSTRCMNTVGRSAWCPAASMKWSICWRPKAISTIGIANRLEVADGCLTGKVLGEIVSKTVKLHALQTWADRLGIPMSQTVAVGDGANDIPMIQAAGLGLAFCAKPKTQLAADKAINDRDLTHVLDYLRR